MKRLIKGFEKVVSSRGFLILTLFMLLVAFQNCGQAPSSRMVQAPGSNSSSSGGNGSTTTTLVPSSTTTTLSTTTTTQMSPTTTTSTSSSSTTTRMSTTTSTTRMTTTTTMMATTTTTSSTTTTTRMPTSGDPTTLPLMDQSDIAYLGRFTVPGIFEYGGRGLAVVGNTMYLSSLGMNIGRITIPAINGTATVIQNPVSIPGDPGGNLKTLNGAMIYNNRLIIQKGSGYDTGDANGNVIQSGNLSLSSFTALQGVSASNYRYYNGYSFTIPSEWQSLFGGPAFIGSAIQSIISSVSVGPAVAVFDPDTVDGSGTVPVLQTMHYPLSNPLAPPTSTANEYISGASKIAGGAFPIGFRTVFFVGRHGYGPYTYKTDDGGCGGIHGDGAAPYRLQVWLYDANELLRARNGQIAPYAPRPYMLLNISPPTMSSCYKVNMGSFTYDHATRRFYMMEEAGYPNTLYMHVWQVGNP